MPEHLVLPAPAVGHGALGADLDRALAGVPLALSGNRFDAHAIEDCVARSFAEWGRIAGADASQAAAACSRPAAPAAAVPG